MKAKHAAFLILLLVIAVVAWKVSRPATEDTGVSQAGTEDARGKRHGVAVDMPAAADGNPGDASRSDDNASEGGRPDPSVQSAARSTRRGTELSPSGGRLAVIDPMASWQDIPPWPEGPRLFAEVETGSRRYVNLRPDDAGEMPQIRAEAEERIELRVNFPEGEPGEKIFVELPNGGSFADSKAGGRVFELPENRTLIFPYITDNARGHCNVKLRHRGHTRSLPIWVGELPDGGL